MTASSTPSAKRTPRKSARSTASRGRRNGGDSPARFDLYQTITDQIVSLLEAGTAPWKSSVLGTPIGRPMSLTTGRPYRGVNVFLLAMAGLAGGHDSAYWVTYKQAQALGGQVRRGEKGTLVVFWKTLGEGEIDSQTRKSHSDQPDKRFVLRYYRVWNASQCDGITPPDGGNRPEPREHDPIDAADQVLTGFIAPRGPAVSHGEYPSAAYLPASDEVRMPFTHRYADMPSFYCDCFHELGHSTGHKQRLDRWGDAGPASSFRSDSYSKEELVAEMTAAFLCGHCGISPSTIENSASYLAGWIERLKGDKRLVIAAAGQAQKAADLILGTPAFEPRDDA
ncbi:MAG: ArdC-like ssDNA-binding domain-containing protein [Planctomycetota bacterium]